VIRLPYIVTCAVLVIAPGPTFSVLVDQSLRHGRGTGLLTVAGNTTGLAVWAGASAVGLTGLISASRPAFIVLKTTGACYLCYLGVESLLNTRRGTPRTPGDPARRRGSGFRAGLITNLTNPKAAVLYLTLIPRFLPTHAHPAPALIVLTVVQMAISVTWYSLVVLFVQLARHLLSRDRVRAWVQRISGLVLIGLGLRMVALGRAAP
jgi:threonine/homoserine/homoserine lactone efflux protein